MWQGLTATECLTLIMRLKRCAGWCALMQFNQALSSASFLYQPTQTAVRLAAACGPACIRRHLLSRTPVR